MRHGIKLSNPFQIHQIIQSLQFKGEKSVFLNRSQLCYFNSSTLSCCVTETETDNVVKNIKNDTMSFLIEKKKRSVRRMTNRTLAMTSHTCWGGNNRFANKIHQTGMHDSKTSHKKYHHNVLLSRPGCVQHVPSILETE